VERLLKEYPTELRVVFRQKPAEGDPTSFRAAEASLCAADQSKYWAFRRAVFAHQEDLSDAGLARDAAEAGLDVPSFERCLDSATHRSSIEGDVKEARTLGYEGSPVFSLNGTRLSGAHELATFKELIDTELKWRAGQHS
jgi:protein-disulfide isomerase